MERKMSIVRKEHEIECAAIKTLAVGNDINDCRSHVTQASNDVSLIRAEIILIENS